jgi:hypothetical protein
VGVHRFKSQFTETTTSAVESGLMRIPSWSFVERTGRNFGSIWYGCCVSQNIGERRERLGIKDVHDNSQVLNQSKRMVPEIQGSSVTLVYPMHSKRVNSLSISGRGWVNQ